MPWSPTSKEVLQTSANSCLAESLIPSREPVSVNGSWQRLATVFCDYTGFENDWGAYMALRNMSELNFTDIGLCHMHTPLLKEVS